MLRGRFYGHLGPRSAFKCTWDTKNPVFFFAIVVFWLIQFSSLSSLSVISISRWIDIVLVIHYQLSCTQAMNKNMQHIRADRRLKHTSRKIIIRKRPQHSSLFIQVASGPSHVRTKYR